MNIDQSWTLIEKTLKSKFPSVEATLNSGASLEKLDELEARVGQPLPADFRASLLRHDGQFDPIHRT